MLNRVGPGECFGELAYLDEQRPPRSANIESRTPLVLVGIEIEALQLLRSERAATTERLTATVGTLVMHQERDVIFHVKNSGTAPMHLLSSEAACGCTTAELPKEAIAPGAQIPVTVHFSGRAPDGPLVREVKVLTDGTPGQIVLVIEGTVVP